MNKQGQMAFLDLPVETNGVSGPFDPIPMLPWSVITAVQKGVQG